MQKLYYNQCWKAEAGIRVFLREPEQEPVKEIYKKDPRSQELGLL